MGGQDGRCRALDVLPRRAPVAHRDAHQRPSAPDGSREPASAVALRARDDLAGPRVAFFDGRPGMLEVVVALAARTLQIGRGPRHGGAVGGGVAHEGETAVIGNVQPLVRVGGPGVRGADALEQVAEARARRGPEAECAVDVHPGVAVRARQAGDLAKRIERAGVHVAGLRTDDGGRALRRPEGPPQRPGPPAGPTITLYLYDPRHPPGRAPGRRRPRGWARHARPAG